VIQQVLQNLEELAPREGAGILTSLCVFSVIVLHLLSVYQVDLAVDRDQSR